MSLLPHLSIHSTAEKTLFKAHHFGFIPLSLPLSPFSKNKLYFCYLSLFMPTYRKPANSTQQNSWQQLAETHSSVAVGLFPLV